MEYVYPMREDELPACPEDSILDWSNSILVCGPAYDDLALETHTEDCDYLVGRGQYEGGRWDEYVCAVERTLPDTAQEVPSGLPLDGIGLIVVLLAASLFSRSKRSR